MDKNHLKINSNEYWDERFGVDWEKFEGHQQTDFFAKLLIENLPKWITTHFQNSTICDAGCAEGQGARAFKENFPTAIIEGIDFSEVAIEKAKELYPDIHFFKDDIYNLKKSYDNIFISNVIEHFEKPFEVIEKLLEKVKKHLIIMIPFQEVELLKEHFTRFDYDSFPIRIGDFSLSYFKEIDCRLLEGSLWDGKQAIVIYTNTVSNDSTLEDIHMIQANDQYLKEMDLKIKQQNSKIMELGDWGTKLHHEIIEKDQFILSLNQKYNEMMAEKNRVIIENNQKIQEVSHWGISLQNKVEERDKLILELNEKISEVSEWAKKLQQEKE